MTLIKFAVYSAFLVLVGMLFSTAWLHEATASQILNGAGAISSVAWFAVLQLTRDKVAWVDLARIGFVHVPIVMSSRILSNAHIPYEVIGDVWHKVPIKDLPVSVALDYQTAAMHRIISLAGSEILLALGVAGIVYLLHVYFEVE